MGRFSRCIRIDKYNKIVVFLVTAAVLENKYSEPEVYIMLTGCQRLPIKSAEAQLWTPSHRRHQLHEELRLLA